jgi:hypothetical protein
VSTTEIPNSTDLAQTAFEEPQAGAMVRAGAIPDYELTEPTSEIAVEWKGVLTKHKVRQATKPEFINLAQAFIRSTENLGGGRERFRFSDDEAFSSHYMIISQQAWVLENYQLVSDFDDAAWIELTPTQIGELTFELRAEVIRQLYRADSVLEREAKGYDHLFDRDGLWIVKQSIGNPLNPQFVIRHKMARPGGERRLRYRDNANRIETQQEGKKSRRDIIIDINEGMKLYREYFRGIASGATIYGKPFNEDGKPNEQDPERRADRDIVLQMYNGLWQADAADALVSSYQKLGSD